MSTEIIAGYSRVLEPASKDQAAAVAKLREDTGRQALLIIDCNALDKHIGIDNFSDDPQQRMPYLVLLNKLVAQELMRNKLNTAAGKGGLGRRLAGRLHIGRPKDDGMILLTALAEEEKGIRDFTQANFTTPESKLKANIVKTAITELFHMVRETGSIKENGATAWPSATITPDTIVKGWITRFGLPYAPAK